MRTFDPPSQRWNAVTLSSSSPHTQHLRHIRERQLVRNYNDPDDGMGGDETDD